jgi:hypothetical protein
MPAYNYFPATYQSPYYQQNYMQPMIQQPIQQSVQQPVMQQTQQIQNGIIWVSGDAEANAYPIAPNNAVRLWHSSLPIVYFKSADASGKPTLKAYDLVERTEKASAATEIAESKVADFVTKDELSAISLELEALKNEFKTVKKEYVKKKRREEEDDDE